MVERVEDSFELPEPKSRNARPNLMGEYQQTLQKPEAQKGQHGQHDRLDRPRRQASRPPCLR